MLKTIILCGKGGQGIKSASVLLAELLTKNGFETSLTIFHDGPIRGGDIYSIIIYSDRKIENPIAEKTDLLILLSEVKEIFDATETIADSTLSIEANDKIPFIEHAQLNFNSNKSANMVAFGFLLKKLNISFLENKNFIPEKFHRAIELGMHLIKYTN